MDDDWNRYTENSQVPVSEKYFQMVKSAEWLINPVFSHYRKPPPLVEYPPKLSIVSAEQLPGTVGTHWFATGLTSNSFSLIGTIWNRGGNPLHHGAKQFLMNQTPMSLLINS